MYNIEMPKEEIYCYSFNKFCMHLTIQRIAKNEKEFIGYLARGFRKDVWGFLVNDRMND